MLELIKGEKKLSFKNWRYRLLHWTLGVSPKDESEGVDKGVPRFLYTHYCPLFHLTNLLVLVFPLVAIFKVFKPILVSVVIPIIEKVINYLIETKVFAKSEEARKRDQINEFLKMLKKGAVYTNPSESFDDRTYRLNHNESFNLISNEEMLEIFNKYKETVKSKEAVEKQRVKNQRVVFLVNMSQMVFKTIFYLALVSLAFFVIKLLMFIVPLIIKGVLTLSFAVLFLDFVQIAIYLGIIVLMGVALWYTIVKHIAHGVVEVSGNILWWLGQRVDETIKFVSMFYETNCPPIKIVNEQEELIERAVE